MICKARSVISHRRRKETMILLYCNLLSNSTGHHLACMDTLKWRNMCPQFKIPPIRQTNAHCHDSNMEFFSKNFKTQVLKERWKSNSLWRVKWKARSSDIVISGTSEYLTPCQQLVLFLVEQVPSQAKTNLHFAAAKFKLSPYCITKDNVREKLKCNWEMIYHI